MIGVIDDPDTPQPQVQLLSNGSYHVMLTSAGGGYSRWKNLAITRWTEDAACDDRGAFCYIRDVKSGDVWSSALQPTLERADTYRAVFGTGRAEFGRFDRGLETRTEIVVAPDADVELRRIRITNGSRTRRMLDLTSYAEIVLAPPATDSAHPAFSKLFVETEFLRDGRAIVCKRRPQASGDPAPWMFHWVAARTAAAGEISFETDRACFIGRGRTTADPQALDRGATLSGSVGSVLDPVAAMRCGVVLVPGESAVVDWVSGIGEARTTCLDLLRRYRNADTVDQAFVEAPLRAQAMLHTLGATESDARVYARLAGHVVYADASLRAAPDVVASNHRGQSNLWAYGISGDLPIVLLRIADPAGMALVRQLVHAHRYWRLHGLAADLVILDEAPDGPAAGLQDEIAQLVAACGGADHVDKPGGTFVRMAAKVAGDDKVLLQAVARIVMSDADGTLAQQLDRRSAMPAARVPKQAALVPTSAAVVPTPAELASTAATVAAVRLTESDARTASGTVSGPRRRAAESDLIFTNGLGGFTADGREYVITVATGQMTPAPWANVLANPGFGTLVSESGSASTWSENAQQFRLTPWSNDPIGDANTEAYYLRDEESGHVWSPTLLPCGSTSPYVARHGFGYSVFEHEEEGIDSEVAVYVAIDAPVKFVTLKLCNRSKRPRRLSVTGYLEWVLGDERSKTCMHVRTERDEGTGALFAQNPYNTDFAGQIAFVDVDEIAAATICCDRVEFLGRNGTLRGPAAMRAPELSGSVGAALDPCAAIRIPVELAADETRAIIFRLGAGASADEARHLVRRWRGTEAARDALTAVTQHWEKILGAVQVETPNRSLDLLTNGWLLYQIVASRLWGRNAFYQSSGAFGFRDQLQDVMALVHAAPERVREHLLLCASRQFPEGDVQHWWHPPSGRGVRTRCSDDYLWLPLAACRYTVATGDAAVLDEPVHFLDGRALRDDEMSYYDLPTRSNQAASLYDHCVAAIEHGLRFGAHGVPLMGSGDWNDGMNLVGAGGKGESVWLGFFLYSVLVQFRDLAQRRGDAPFAERCTAESTRLRTAIEKYGWDGGWYRRAWFDDGSPLGTSSNVECTIDSIAQSWSVLSGAGEPQRSRTAMDAVDRQLVDRDAAVVRLLAPPFDRSEPNPGYIQGYVRGVRENGGQYTHAAVWAAMAFAALGDVRRAWELFAMLDPINHAASPDAVARYMTEPYVLASDVYALAPHAGRGGWTWYTGSAGWMYQLIVESMLGLRREADALRFSPCLPPDWTAFKLRYRFRGTLYRITVQAARAANEGPKVMFDGDLVPGMVVPLIDDGREHAVDVIVRADAR